MKAFRGRPVSGNFSWLTTINLKHQALMSFPGKVENITEPIKGVCTIDFGNDGSFTCKLEDLNSITTTPMMLDNIMRM
ncbi:hypothetical protein DKZ22_11215 [Limosilactobacillus reuteri]|uniref:Uncharacterized protein n=1 Tax=Limosilactobacillus reuteri TaxID=1598 RepID=A0A855XK77_LIMRT|nr:hypothetical protein [Limosilactobacillus reuteri]PWT34146.1 hypothetical protein DKZ21_00715 [Limosilactobacillus reuteri]PWT39346.1 hypothetical protein DKZ22_11215 [Limosilactobacillus reuteri]PWT45578.1 hypothetical protein DKZ25_00715 [Limosilactobacillus reuteri]PWT68184.1 hypothetical protein DKZ26_10580 [Limosilactobacillus reuteri]